jgi:hypothetical protein
MLQTLQRHLVSLNVVHRNLENLVQGGVIAKEQLDFEKRQTAMDRARKALRIA